MAINPNTGALYTGHTDDISRHTHEHRHGPLSGSGRDHGCNKLVWHAEFGSRAAAPIIPRVKLLS
ncbi:MAG: hypothetical protein V7675_10275 [Hyphomonas sp.]|uniref:GIY-YIG nuclease family protein n=1 Tax=Hyphomonas sp. TaxID=87 RepID=UPI003003924D